MIEIELLTPGVGHTDSGLKAMSAFDFFPKWQHEKKKASKTFKIRSVQLVNNSLFVVYEP